MKKFKKYKKQYKKKIQEGNEIKYSIYYEKILKYQ